jgi:hypothetical protein
MRVSLTLVTLLYFLPAQIPALCDKIAGGAGLENRALGCNPLISCQMRMRLRGGQHDNMPAWMQEFEKHVRDVEAGEAGAEVAAAAEEKEEEEDDDDDDQLGSSTWSESDIDRVWEQQAVRRQLAGITTPHPHDLKWNMTYFDDRGMDVTEGALKLDSNFMKRTWNIFCAVRDRMLKKTGVYESYWLEDGKPNPDFEPFPDASFSPANHSGVQNQNDVHDVHVDHKNTEAEGPWLGEQDENLSSEDSHECRTRRQEQAAALYQGRDPLWYPVCNMTEAHWQALTEEQLLQRVERAVNAFERGKRSPLYNLTFVLEGAHELPMHERLIASILGIETSYVFLQAHIQHACTHTNTHTHTRIIYIYIYIYHI